MKRSLARTTLCMAALALCACAAPDPGTAPADAATQQQNFQHSGFLASDVAAIARHVAADLPQTPQLRQHASPVTVLVNEQRMRALDGRVVLAPHLFAQQLLAELRRHPDMRIRYTSQRETSGTITSRGVAAARNDSGRSGDSSAGGRGRAGQEDASYVLAVDVSSLPAEPGKPNTQQYAMQLEESQSRRAVWQGSFVIDAPGAATAK